MPKNLLIVDDNPGDHELLRVAADEVGWDVGFRSAYDGEDGLRQLRVMLARGEPPALVVVDLNMPRLTGWQFIEAVRAGGFAEHVPIIAYTSSLSPRDCALAVQLGAEACVVKADDLDGLLDFVRDLRHRLESGAFPTVLAP